MRDSSAAASMARVFAAAGVWGERKPRQTAAAAAAAAVKREEVVAFIAAPCTTPNAKEGSN
jgi:hypothetical protein